MRQASLGDMVKGWFVGDFEPTVLRTTACEVAIKAYAAGAREEEHFHRVATEITVIVSGEVEMCGRTFRPGDIVVLEPGDATAFHARTDASTVVVKIPGAANDKYICDADGVHSSEWRRPTPER